MGNFNNKIQACVDVFSIMERRTSVFILGAKTLAPEHTTFCWVGGWLDTLS